MFMAAIAMTSTFGAKADWVKNVQLSYFDFLSGTHSFTTANSNLSGNNVGAPTVANGYLYTAASGSGARGTKITNMTSTDARQDTVYYEFDWNPYKVNGQANATGTNGIEPASYAVCIVRGSNDSIAFGLWFERWSQKAGSKYNSVDGTEPLGDIHLMNLSTDPNNPVPAAVVQQTKPDLSTWSYYTNTLVPFAMQDLNFSSNFYAVKCDSINQSTDLGAAFKMNRWYHVKAILDFKNKKVASFEIFEVDQPANKKTYTDLPFVNTGTNDVSRFEVASTRGKKEGETGNGVNTDYEQRFDNFDIYTVRQAVAATVTIKYVDANGVELKSARTIPSIEVGTTYTASAADKVTIIIGDDYYVYDPNSVDNVLVQVGGSEIVLKFIKAVPSVTTVQLTAPATTELYKDVKLDIAVKDAANNAVPFGDVLVFVNKLVKNRVTLDVLGTGSVTFPNLLVGDEEISAVYIGDHINYSTSDTAKTTVTVTASTSNIKPYPVYFDLVDQPEIQAWDRARGMTTATPRAYTHYFRRDSLEGISVTDTINESHKVGYYYAGSTYDKIDNAYNRADFVMVPLGSGRPTWVKFKTPWLNAGSYNIYISHRVSGDAKTNMTTIQMNDKELYFPNEEMYGRWFKSWVGVNNRRRWNATGHSGSMGMNYIGSVSIDQSGTHQLKINVASENGATYNLDMLQFIPVDMDSLNINLPAAESMAKNYYPMFDWLGFAHLDGTTTGMTTYSDFTEFAVPYQVADPTVYEKNTGKIESLGIKTIVVDNAEMIANYVIVYKAEDKWTRVAEGSITENHDFSYELPAGNYYYQEINYIDMGIAGAAGYRTFISDGTFTVEAPNQVINQATSKIKAFSLNSTLVVRGIEAGAEILVTDLSGRIIVNKKSQSTSFTQALRTGAYLVKVISEGETLRTKVIVK